MAVSDATLLAISTLSVGTPVADASDFTGLTPAEVAAKFELFSQGGDAGSAIYAPGADGDYDALDPDLPPVTDLGLWAVGGFINLWSNPVWSGGTTGAPGAQPTYNSVSNITQIDATVIGTYKALPLWEVTYTNIYAGVRTAFIGQNSIAAMAGDNHYVSAFVSSQLSEHSLDVCDYGNGRASTPLSTELSNNKVSSTVVVDGTTRHSISGNVNPAQANTYQLAGAQSVKNSGCHLPVLALSSAATTTKLAAITQREVAVWKPFVVLVEATTGEDPGANQVFYSLSRSADELIEIYRATSTDQMTLHIRSGGVDYTDALGSVADNTAFSVAINVFASFTAASLDGGAVQVLTAPKPSGVLTLESIGCKHDGTLQCNGPIAECTLIHPAIYPAAQLEAA